MTNPDKTSDSEVKKTLREKILKILLNNAEEPDDIMEIGTFQTYRVQVLINQILQAVEEMVKRIVGKHVKNDHDDYIYGFNDAKKEILDKLKKEIYGK